MVDADDSAELRMLRAKAYGRGGQLSTAELERLQELEGRGSSSAAAAPPPQGDPQPLPPHTEPSIDEFFGALSEHSETKRVEPSEGAATSSPDEASPPDEAAPDETSSPGEASPDEKPPRRWPLLAAASVAILAAGLGIGWGIWGWDSEASALTATHSGTQAEIEAQQLYDPGTVVPVAEEHGVVVWQADRSDGEELCVIITAADQKQHGCITYEQLADYAWPSATATVPEGQEEAGHQISAGLISTTTGELVPFVQVWNMEPSAWESQYTDAELEQLREIEAAGHMGGALSILGHDGDTVIWSSWETGNLCVIAPTDAGIVEACADDPEASVSLTASVDGLATRYVVTQSDRLPPQLTVYKDVDTDYYFDNPDEPMFDDLFADDPSIDDTSIDDKTGEAGE